MKKHFSRAYVEHRKHGPFPGQIDPWAESGRYFQQIHAGLIGHLLTQIQDPLLELGYEAGRETSLQILERREPDLYVRREVLTNTIVQWDYPAVAQAISAEPGVAIEGDAPDFHAVYVKDIDSGDLVTVVEVVSPSNKVHQQEINEYVTRRDNILRKGVNIVEIDPTRSVKRLLHDTMTAVFDYHIAVFLPGALPRVIGSDFGIPLKRTALPLRGEAIVMELQVAYDFAYQQASIAGQIHSDGNYIERELPFPSLLGETERHAAINQVHEWVEQLNQLKAAS